MIFDWTAISGSAAAISALAAAAAAALSLKAVRAANRLAIEQRSSDYFKKYLELAIENPELSTDDDATEDDHEQQRYEWFVSFALMAVKADLVAHPNNDNWRTMMAEQIRYNSAELKTWREKYPLILRSFGPEVEELVKEVLAEKKSRPSYTRRSIEFPVNRARKRSAAGR